MNTTKVWSVDVVEEEI